MRTTIRIFIASSSELKEERDSFDDLFADLTLSDEFHAKEIKLFPEKWEFCDSSMRSMHKEQQYLERLRNSEICIVLFWNVLGRYTKEELDVAVTESATGRLPKRVFTFFKEPAERMSPELRQLKEQFRELYPSVPIETYDDIQSLHDKVEQILCKLLNN